MSCIIFIASVDKKNNDLYNKPQSQFIVGYGYTFKIQQEVKSTQKQPSCIKRVWHSKKLGLKKSCEIKGGGHGMAAMMWMIINFNNVPYMTALKPGSNTRRGSNIRRVQLGDCHNKRRGSFKRRDANDMH